MTLKAIQYKKGYTFVDNSKVYNEDMYYSTGLKEVYKAIVDEPEEVSDRRDFKIIAQSPEISIEGVPYVELEEDVRKLAQNYRDDKYEQIAIGKTKGQAVTASLHAEQGWFDGYSYKAAQSKKFSEEDVRKAISGAVYTIPCELYGSRELVEHQNRIIQSLQPKIESIELEMKPKHNMLGSEEYVLEPEKPVTYQKDGKTFLKVKQINYGK